MPVPAENNPNEKEWLRRGATGDEAAFTALFDAYKNRIYTIALRLTDSPFIAEEIVQDIRLRYPPPRQGIPGNS